MRLRTTLLLSPLIFSCAYAHQATPFTGLSVLGGVGGIIAEVDVNQNVQADVAGFLNPAMPADLQLSQLNFIGMIGADYSYQFENGILLGAIFTAGFTPVQISNTADFSTEQSTIINLTSSIQTQLKNDFALLFKPGYVLGSTLFYGLVGPRWGNFETTLNTDFRLESPPSPDIGEGDGTDTTSGYSLGFTAGLGIQQQVTQQLRIGLEYAYTNYNNLPSPEVNTGIFVGTTPFGTLTDTPKLDAFTNTFMMTLSYRL